MKLSKENFTSAEVIGRPLVGGLGSYLKFWRILYVYWRPSGETSQAVAASGTTLEPMGAGYLNAWYLTSRL
jgi:hypothetical protein